jgi:glycosyltransferase involved in cell wall biosynthesis
MREDRFLHPRMMPQISAVIITLNEERRITRCLDSIQWMHEIVIIDSGSQDATCDLARRYTDLIFQKEFIDYASQKNYGITKASNEWIFSIDADEVMPPQLRVEIEETILKDTPVEMYAVPRENIYFNHSVRHVLGDDRPVRLFMRSKARFEGKVHEKVIGGFIGQMKSPLMHYSCDTYQEWVQKHRRYIVLDAKMQFASGRQFSWPRFVFSPCRTFLYRYGVLQGWRDGWAGFAIAFEMAFSMILFHLELRRLSKNKKKGIS